MGMGYWYKCEKCKQAYVFIYRNAYLLRPQTDEEVNAQIAASTNEDLKEFVKTFPEGRLDRTKQTYLCPRCGRFRNEYDLSMYIPDGSAEKLEDYLIPFKDSGYILFQSNPHICSECGITMETMEFHDFEYDFKCPSCGFPLKFVDGEHFRG